MRPFFRSTSSARGWAPPLGNGSVGVARRTLLGVLGALPLLWACSGGSAAPAKSPKKGDAVSAPEPSPIERPALSEEEQATQRRLEGHLERLSGKIGERHPGKAWELADSADYLATELEGMGYALERQGYEAGDGGEVAAQNLIVTSPGGAGGEQVIVVGAHYDSPPGDPGRNAGGSGAAAVLELARAFAQGEHSRTLRFCLFALGESPHGDGGARGARVYGEGVAKRRAAAEAELAKDAELKASGALPAALPAPAVDRSHVVGVVLLDRLLRFDHGHQDGAEHVVVRLSSGDGSDAYVGALADELSTAPLMVERAHIYGSATESDATYWLSQKVPVVLVHGDLRVQETPAPGAAPAAPPAADDLDALTRVVFGVRAALLQASGAEVATESPFLQ